MGRIEGSSHVGSPYRGDPLLPRPGCDSRQPVTNACPPPAPAARIPAVPVRRPRSAWSGRLLIALAGALAVAWASPASAQAPLRKIAELRLSILGISATVEPANPAVPKNTPAGLRVVVRSGERELSLLETAAVFGAGFEIQGDLTGPGLSKTLALPVHPGPAGRPDRPGRHPAGPHPAPRPPDPPTPGAARLGGLLRRQPPHHRPRAPRLRPDPAAGRPPGHRAGAGDLGQDAPAHPRRDQGAGDRPRGRRLRRLRVRPRPQARVRDRGHDVPGRLQPRRRRAAADDQPPAGTRPPGPRHAPAHHRPGPLPGGRRRRRRRGGAGAEAAPPAERPGAHLDPERDRHPGQHRLPQVLLLRSALRGQRDPGGLGARGGPGDGDDRAAPGPGPRPRGHRGQPPRPADPGARREGDRPAADDGGARRGARRHGGHRRRRRDALAGWAGSGRVPPAR